MSKKWVVANWKMNGSLEFLKNFSEAFVKAPSKTPHTSIVLCPAFVHLMALKNFLAGTGVALGAQDLSCFSSGAHTGEISGAMLAEMGCTYVIIGHSERRAQQSESDALVREKFLQARLNGLAAIVCLGETLQEREGGHTEEVVARQLEAVLSVIAPQDYSSLMLAYEPVWAIGTGKTPTLNEIENVHRFLREKCRKCAPNLDKVVRIIYGGSVNSKNASPFICLPNVDGVLVGGASLIPNELESICFAAESFLCNK